MTETVQQVLDRYADGTPYEALAAAFRDHRRWTGDDPRLLLAEAAASTTGQSFRAGIEATVDRFRETFVATGRIDSFAALAELDREDDALIEAVGAQRKRHVLVEAAGVLAARPEADDREALLAWAETADIYRYDADPLGALDGVGPSTFQYLRKLAGVPVLTPDPTAIALLETVADDLEASPITTDTDLRTIASGEWLALESSYTPLEIDRLAWWRYTDPADRRATLETHDIAVDAPE